MKNKKTSVKLKKSIKAFTLAEVLITLGIIGIIISITLPALIHHQKKIIIESRLKKFYTVINQAILQAETEFGDKENWYIKNNDDFFNTYLKKYLITTHVEDLETSKKLLDFPDGSSAILNIYHMCPGTRCGGHIVFCPKSKDCKKGINSDLYGTKQFQFAYMPNHPDDRSFQHHYKKGVEPYKAYWYGTEANLKTYCNNTSGTYCTALIQYHGWKIPDDYPKKL